MWLQTTVSSHVALIVLSQLCTRLTEKHCWVWNWMQHDIWAIVHRKVFTRLPKSNSKAMLQPDYPCAFFTTPLSSSNLKNTPVLQAFRSFTAFGMAPIRECRKFCNTLADSRYSSYASRSNLVYVRVSVSSIPANSPFINRPHTWRRWYRTVGQQMSPSGELSPLSRMYTMYTLRYVPAETGPDTIIL